MHLIQSFPMNLYFSSWSCGLDLILISRYNGLEYSLFYGISTPYGLFNTEI